MKVGQSLNKTNPTSNLCHLPPSIQLQASNPCFFLHDTSDVFFYADFFFPLGLMYEFTKNCANKKKRLKM